MNKKFYILILVILSLCFKCKPDEENLFDYRHEMRKFVIEIADYSHLIDSNFIIIPQNGQELITNTGRADGELQVDYIAHIDATGREDLFYGYTADNRPTPANESEHMLQLCILCENNNVEVLTTDYCHSEEKMLDSYNKNQQQGFISFAANKRELSNIPDFPSKPFNENNQNIHNIEQVKNFLYLINPEEFSDKTEFIGALSQTNYDLLIIDLFLFDEILTPNEIESLKTKQNGSKRLVTCYMSIGEAENYRYYWQKSWKTDEPEWLQTENKNWEGNFKVNYWHPEWKAIIYGHKDSYLDKILAAKFDGVYLDLIDAYEYFEMQ